MYVTLILDHFKQKKSHIWSYTCCLISMLKLRSIPDPHPRKDIEPDNIFDHIVSQYNCDLLVKYMTVYRIWNGDYVRQNSYNREISNWISKQKSLLAKLKTIKPKDIKNNIVNNYIEIAENIISQKEVFRKTERITMLEALRHIDKIKPGKNLSYYTSKLI